MKATRATTRAEIRRRALLAAPSLWLCAAILGVLVGLPTATAVGRGAGAALAGLAAWFAYHAFSRRVDGLGILGMGFGQLASGAATGETTTHAFVKGLVIGLIGLLPVAFLGGIWVRGRPDEPHPRGEPADGLGRFDPGVDAPST